MSATSTAVKPYCRELVRLREILAQAVAGSAAATLEPEDSVLSAALRLARLSCEAANAAIEAHQAEHGCGEPDVGMEVVKLFNVSTERWEAIQTAVHGHPPAGALAYQSDRARWIVDLRDLAKSQQAGIPLHYTEHGLEILRRDGLEM